MIQNAIAELNRHAHPDQRFGCFTLAQHGDDLMLLNLFELMGIEHPTYLDIGAHHPFIISNTALLYERGSRGVNVEANPNLLAEFFKHRPGDVNLNVGVGLQNGVFPFFMYSPTCGLNTFSKDETATHANRYPIVQVLDLPMITLDDLVRKYCGGHYPDLLTIDIEGLDYAVLNSADFSRSCPKVVVAEVRRGESALIKELMTKHHSYILYCRTGENLFFVHESFKHLVY